MSIDTFMKQLFGEKKQVQYLSGRRQVGTVKHLVVEEEKPILGLQDPSVTLDRLWSDRQEAEQDRW